ncbi:MAG: alpha/beta hydrolase family protein [Tropicimonas sp.]|uniref:alpha/beta hydrolase family protein n=1 Tax=Tropicimonas sp. TaxID=2067044 RepID=UPI003A865431
MSVLKRVLQSCAVAVILAAPVAAPALAQDLFANEKIETAAGFPAITMFRPGDADRPLVVFIPGAHHTARVAYGGHEGSRDEDFLAHWLNQAGYNFLAISYPIDTVVGGIPTEHPEFTIRDWGKQAAALARQYVDANGLNGDVIVMGWSMGGKISQSVHEAMRDEGLDLEFYTSVTATAPLPGLIALTRELPMLETGLADRRNNYAGWFAQVAKNSEAIGHEIVSEQVFTDLYQGDIPVGLQGYAQVYRDGAFVIDQLAFQADAKPFAFKDFPLVAMIIPDGRGDRRHALTDQAIWSMYNANTVYNSWITANEVDVNTLSDEAWRGMLDLTRGLDEALSVTIDGNHFFFMGEPGAKATAEALAQLEGNVAEVKAKASDLLGVTID